MYLGVILLQSDLSMFSCLFIYLASIVFFAFKQDRNEFTKVL